MNVTKSLERSRVNRPALITVNPDEDVDRIPYFV